MYFSPTGLHFAKLILLVTGHGHLVVFMTRYYRCPCVNDKYINIRGVNHKFHHDMTSHQLTGQ